MTDTKALARNIINQLGDQLHLALVERGVDSVILISARQATNDAADIFVAGLLDSFRDEVRKEAASEIESAITRRYKLHKVTLVRNTARDIAQYIRTKYGIFHSRGTE